MLFILRLPRKFVFRFTVYRAGILILTLRIAKLLFRFIIQIFFSTRVIQLTNFIHLLLINQMFAILRAINFNSPHQFFRD